MQKRKGQSTQNQSRYSPMLVVAIVAGVLLVGLLFDWAGRSDRQLSSRTNTQSDSYIPPFFASAEAAEPLPKTLSAKLFPDPNVAAAYRAAERIPSVLVQQPCIATATSSATVVCSIASRPNMALVDRFVSRRFSLLTK